MAKAKKNRDRADKKDAVKRLLIANLIAALGLLTITVAVLFALGLLDSIFAFIF